MSRKYDLVIVGAGPAGLMAARVAGENGLRTALLERKTAIARIRRIDGGILSPLNEYTFGQTVTFNPEVKRIGFPVCGFSIPYDGPYQNVYGFDMFSPGGTRITFGDREKQRQDPQKYRVGVSLDKELMLQGLLDEVEKAGVDIFPGINVTGIEKKSNSVLVTGNGEVFEGQFVIAADGVNSRTARLMGMNKQRKFFATHPECAWYFEDIEIPEIAGIGFVFTAYGNFYISQTCFKNHYHVGITSFTPTNEFPAKLNRFVYEDEIYSKWFKGGRKTDEVSCVINMLAPLQEPFKDNVLFIGDAAWLMEVTNVAAMCCGWKAANAVALAMIDGKMSKEGIAGYLEWWEQYFFGPYGQVEFKPFELQDFLEPGDIDYLGGLVTEPLIATMDFYKMVNTLGTTFGELFPVIQEQRPDVMERLMMVANQMDEAEEAAGKAGFPNR